MAQRHVNVLCGDVGGTNARLALFEVRGGRVEPLEEQTFPSRSYSSLCDIVGEFVRLKGFSGGRACFGIAGPVKDGRSETTNLPWVIEARELAAELKIREVALLNDLEANAYGIAALGDDDFLTLNAGHPHPTGNAAVISAGTGLGEAVLYWDGDRHRPFASEGGHTDFAPGNALEAELMAFLSKRYDRVSWERVLSGPGLVNIFEFLCERQGANPPEPMAEAIRTKSGAAISKAGLSGQCEISAHALEIFSRLYGAEAGNLVLTVMATGGIYLGGGIAPKISKALQGRTFLDAFLDKGRMRPILEATPVKVILNDKTALLGTAQHAAFNQAD